MAAGDSSWWPYSMVVAACGGLLHHAVSPRALLPFLRGERGARRAGRPAPPGRRWLGPTRAAGRGAAPSSLWRPQQRSLGLCKRGFWCRRLCTGSSAAVANLVADAPRASTPASVARSGCAHRPERGQHREEAVGCRRLLRECARCVHARRRAARVARAGRFAWPSPAARAPQWDASTPRAPRGAARRGPFGGGWSRRLRRGGGAPCTAGR